MNWIPAYFSENVCNLLAGSAVLTLQNALSSRTWNNAAAQMLEKREIWTMSFNGQSVSDRTVDKIKDDPHKRVTTLRVDVYQEYPEFDKNLAEILPFVAYDDSSVLILCQRAQKKAVKKVMNLFVSERFRNTCFFSTIVNLERVCDASETFLRRCIEKRVLKSLTLGNGWKGTDADWIQELFSQQQLTAFNADDTRALYFGEYAINMLLAAIPTAQPGNRRYTFIFGFLAQRIPQTMLRMAELVTKVGFEKPAKSNTKYHSTFHRGNATIYVYINDLKLSLKVEYR